MVVVVVVLIFVVDQVLFLFLPPLSLPDERTLHGSSSKMNNFSAAFSFVGAIKVR